jgi:hypothetical protein
VTAGRSSARHSFNRQSVVATSHRKVQAQVVEKAVCLVGLPSPRLAAEAMVPWICDALRFNQSVEAYGRDLVHLLRQMQAQGISLCK